jgi:hypothetical protein
MIRLREDLKAYLDNIVEEKIIPDALPKNAIDFGSHDEVISHHFTNH